MPPTPTAPTALTVKEWILSSRAIWLVDGRPIRGALICRRAPSSGVVSYVIRQKGSDSREIALEPTIGRALEQMIDAGAAAALARRSNRITTATRSATARENGRRGGRPRKTPTTTRDA